MSRKCKVGSLLYEYRETGAPDIRFEGWLQRSNIAHVINEQRIYMKNRIDKSKYRIFFRNSVIIINGTLLCTLMVPFCALFVLIDMIWLLTDEIVRKLDSF